MRSPVHVEDDETGDVNWSRWFLVVGLLLGTASFLAIPSLRGPDEFSQVIRMSTVERGSLIFSHTSSAPDDDRFDGCLNSYVGLAFNRIIARPAAPWGTQFDRYSCGPSVPLHGKGALTFTNTEVNPPLPYVPAAVGFRIGRAVGGATWGYLGARLVQMLVYVALVVLALRLLPWGRPFLFAIASIPATMLLSASVSADPVTNGLAFVAIAATLRFVDRWERTGAIASNRALVAYGAALVGLALSKPAVAPLAGVALILPLGVFGTRRRQIISIGTSLATAGIITVAWSLGVVARTKVAIFPVADSLASARWIRSHPLDWIVAVGRGWTDPAELRHVFSELVTVVTTDQWAPYPPVWVVVALVAMLAIVRLGDPIPRWFHRVTSNGVSEVSTSTPTRPRRQRRNEVIVAALIGVVGFWLMEYGVALSANAPGAPRIHWMQGRYFIPYLPLLLLGARPNGRLTGRGRLVCTWLPITSLIGVNLWWLSVVLRTFYTW